MSLEEVAVVSRERSSELVALDEALTTLAKVDERKSRLVELRYFGGLTIEETAAVLGVSDETIRREWIRAKAFLHRELNRD
jgi:RNA polymerase sigma factor (sigma-70 family)